MFSVQFIDVKEKLQQKIQPVVMIDLTVGPNNEKLKKLPVVYVAGDIYSDDPVRQFSIYNKGEQKSKIARVPISAYLTPRQTESDLFGIGMELMSRFLTILNEQRVEIINVTAYIGTECHLITDRNDDQKKIRAYCGIAVRSK